MPDNRSKVDRFFLPLIGLVVALTAYALQSVWGFNGTSAGSAGGLAIRLPQ